MIMKKILPIILIISIIFLQNSGILPVFASGLQITGTKIGELENDTALLSWHSNEKSKAKVYYGLDANNLDQSRIYAVYATWHELRLTNLTKNKTYYYKMVAQSESGESVETFVQSFSTKGMKDTIAPKFLSTKIYQSTSDAIAIGWETDERTKGTAYYGTSVEDLNKRQGFGYGTVRDMYFYNLRPNTKYYIKVVAQDGDGNDKTNFFVVQTRRTLDKNTDLQITNIKPTNFDSELVFANQINLSWSNNIISKGIIYYGTDPNRLNVTVDSNKKELAFEHKIILEDLKPNTTYYYKIKSYGGLYNKSATTNIMSFNTLPEQAAPQNNNKPTDEEVLGEKIISTEGLGSIALDKNHAYYCSEFPNLSVAENFYYTYRPLGYNVRKMNTNGNAKICENVKFKNTNSTSQTSPKTTSTGITAQQVLGIKITSPFGSGTDSDGDGLPDTFEAQIATDPFNPDTDGDGYNDGEEITNNYNPHGPGKIWEKIYDQYRMNDDIVANKANELKYYLGQADVDLNDIGSLEWVYLLNAYVYGEYPEKAIIQAIKFGGRTVHPTVPWKFWRNSEDYNYFINR